MKKVLIFSISLMLGAGMGERCPAQDIHFSQFTCIPLLLNPASSGLGEGKFRASAGYKTQWASMGNPYRSMQGSFDMSLLSDKKKPAYLGAGTYFFSDKAGDAHLGTSSANLCLSAIVPLDDQNNISAGVTVGMFQRSANISALQWPGQYNGQTYDPSISSNEVNQFNTFSQVDISAGVYYKFLKSMGNIQGKDILRIEAGMGYHHLNKPAQEFYLLQPDALYQKLVFTASGRIDIAGTKFGLMPSVLYMSQGRASELSVGTMLRYRVSEGTKVTGFKTEAAVSGGILYRNKDAIIPQLLVEVANLGVGLSYDVTVSSLAQSNRKGGGLEIFLKYSHIRDAVFQSK